MIAILMSIRPQHVYNILNLIKLWEIRKKFPSDYVGWVYIYCTKGGEILWQHNNLNTYGELSKDVEKQFCAYGNNGKELDDKLSDFLYKNGIRVDISRGVNATLLNGKVVARFWCDKVEEILTIGMHYHETKTLDKNDLSMLSCLSRKELDDYLQGDNGYAIHITKLEIFDRPKELREFKHLSTGNCWNCKIFGNGCTTCSLTRTPKSWCYVEV